MSLPTFVNPFSVVLRTDTYSCTTNYWLSFMIAPYGAETNSVVWVAPYFSTEAPVYPQTWQYTSFTYTFYVDTVRTYTVTSEGLGVVDAQVTSRFDLAASGTGVAPLSYSFTTAEWSAQTATFFGANPDYLSTGVTIQPIPQLVPPALLGGESNVTIPVVNGSAPGGWSEAFVYPTGTGGPGDINVVALSATDISGTTHAEITPISLSSPVINQGGSVNLNQAQYWHSWPIVNGIPFGVSGDQPFGLVCDRPNVPIGNLVCTSVNNAIPPVIPPVVIGPNAGGAQFSSTLVNTSNWAGFRYLQFLARVTGFATGQPLPRILFGIAPYHLLTQEVCQNALDGKPNLGIWYEVDVTEQGTDGQLVMIDLALPIAGSGVWSEYSSNPVANNQTYTPQFPLGTGMFPVNPITEAVGSGSISGTYPSWIVDQAAAVIVVDAG